MKKNKGIINFDVLKSKIKHYKSKLNNSAKSFAKNPDDSVFAWIVILLIYLLFLFEIISPIIGSFVSSISIADSLNQDSVKVVYSFSLLCLIAILGHIAYTFYECIGNIYRINYDKKKLKENNKERKE